MASAIASGNSPSTVSPFVAPLQKGTNELDDRVTQVVLDHFDEFSAPDPLVVTVLSAEAAGVIRNGLSIPTAFVSTESSAGVALGWTVAPFYCITGVIMAVVGGILLPSCHHDFKNAMKDTSMEEKWRSGLNLFDKYALSAIGVVLCLIGALMFAALIASAQAAVVAFVAAAIPVATLVFVILVIVRGIEMMIRGGNGLRKANQFQKEFQDQCKKGTVAQWLYGEKCKDSAAFKNRVGQKAVDAWTEALVQVDLKQPLDEQLKQLGVYESLLQIIDVGICEERLKQQLILSIGAVMFVGGALFLIGIALTHGAAIPAIAGVACGVAGSSFSLSMEALWMPYDNPKWFKKLAKWIHNKHKQEFNLQGG